MQRPKLNKYQYITHSVILSFFWGLYFYSFYNVYVSPKTIYRGVILLIIIESLLLLSIIITWIKYHLILHRTKEARKSNPSHRWTYNKDWLGYQVISKHKELKNKQIVLVDCVHEDKLKIFKGIRIYRYDE